MNINRSQVGGSRRIFGLRLRPDATELFDYHDCDINEEIKASKRILGRWAGRSQSTSRLSNHSSRDHLDEDGIIRRRHGSAEHSRPSSAERVRSSGHRSGIGGANRPPNTPSILATPMTAAMATPAHASMAPYDSAQGRLAPRYKKNVTPSSERWMAPRGYAARPTPVNMAQQQQQQQHQQKLGVVHSIPELSYFGDENDSASQIVVEELGPSFLEALKPASISHNGNVNQNSNQTNSMTTEQSSQLQHQVTRRRKASLQDDEEEEQEKMQSQYEHGRRLQVLNSHGTTTAVFQQPHQVPTQAPTVPKMFNMAVPPPIAELDQFDEEASTMSAGYMKKTYSSSSSKRRLRSRAETAGLDDSWNSDGQNTSPRSDRSIESPSEIDLDSYLMMEINRVGSTSPPFASAAAAAAAAGGGNGRRSMHSSTNNNVGRRVQLPEYFRSYGFQEDADATQPKIRKRDPADTNSISAFSSTSRTSVCSVSVETRSIFSVTSGGASVMTAASTQSAPPNLWEVDRQMQNNEKRSMVETHTDLFKLPSPSTTGDMEREQEDPVSSNDLMSSEWTGEAKGVPHKVSISFRRLTLRTQVRELKELLLEDGNDQASKKTASSTIPPTPPFFQRENNLERTMSMRMSSEHGSSGGGVGTKKKKTKKHRQASI